MKTYKLLLLLFCYTASAGQIKRLSVNDKVPAFRLHNIVNGALSKLSPINLSKKIIILNFWNSGCGACLHEIPNLSKLQKKFEKELQIIMVTNQSKQQIEGFYKKHSDLRDFNVPTITEDTYLRKLFPYLGNPHLVWIGKDRIVKSITDADALTEENLYTLLSTNKIKLPIKYEIEGFDLSEGPPLFQSGDDFRANAVAYSTLTKFVDHRVGGLGISTTSKAEIRFRAVNSALINLFLFAWVPEVHLTTSNFKTGVIFNQSNKKLFETSNRDEKKSFCYELAISKEFDPSIDQKKFRLRMRKDLDRLFGLTTKVEKVLTECYIISQNDTSENYGGQAQYELTEYIDSSHFENAPVNYFVNSLGSHYNFQLPFFYEGNRNRPVTTTLKKEYETFQEVEYLLQQLGLVIRKERRNIPMLVFDDAN